MPRAERRIAAAIGRTKKGEELGIEAAAGFVGVEGTMEDAKGLASDIAKRAASEALSQTDNVLSTAATNGFRRYLASREFQDAIVKEIGQAAEPIIAEVIGERMADLEARVRAEFAAQFETRVATEVRKRLETAIDDVKRRMT